MSAARTIGMAILGLLGGSIAGAIFGLGCGLAYTYIAATSSTEGYSGFVVAYWILAGLIFGALAGLLFAISRANRRA